MPLKLVEYENAKRNKEELLSSLEGYAHSLLRYYIFNWKNSEDFKIEVCEYINKLANEVIKNDLLYAEVIKRCKDYGHYIKTNEYKTIIEQTIYANTGFFYNPNRIDIRAFLNWIEKPLFYKHYFLNQTSMFLPYIDRGIDYATMNKGIFYFFKTMFIQEEQRTKYYFLKNDDERFDYITSCEDRLEDSINYCELDTELEKDKYKKFLTEADFYYFMEFYNEFVITPANISILHIILMHNIIKEAHFYYLNLDIEEFDKVSKEEKLKNDEIRLAVINNLNKSDIKYIQDYVTLPKEEFLKKYKYDDMNAANQRNHRIMIKLRKAYIVEKIVYENEAKNVTQEVFERINRCLN